MLSKELGGVSEDARRIATWTVIFGLLQAAVKLAKEDQQPWRLVSPAFDAGRWRLALYYDPAEADYWGASLLTADELAKPVTFSSVTMQFKSSTAGSKRIGSSVDTSNVHFDTQGEKAYPRAIPLQVIESHDPSAVLYLSVQLEEGCLATPARVPPSLLNHPLYCDIAFTFPNVCLPLFAFKLSSSLASQKAQQTMPFPRRSRYRTGKIDLKATLKNNESDQAAIDSVVVKSGHSGDVEMTCASNDASTSTETTSPPKCAAQSPTSTVNDPNSIADTTARLLGEEVLQKRWHRIEISDCSWATFRTYLHALYYDAAGWIPSRSRYLAHVYKDTGTPAPELQARQQTSFSAQTNVNVNGTPCCSAHAFYRLADRYLDVRLRERAKVAILRSLTVDTAAFEAFSSLSRSFPDVRDGVIDWIVDHADDVFKSRGWQRAVELVDEGALAGGATVMNRVLTAVREKAARDAREAKAAAMLRGRKHHLDADSE
ncbi:hypothetical protein OF846_005267 [Rhodotorula toruloides]|nr:hypothetical protein OF846_005267 [Rhodotorula toruloides]